ncbi:MAG: zinc-dependent alcohol dehydrogenase family protein [Armatimonadota bacterium]|nr:zinc-dependent alcohol dehydrogenase family protein [Armatimonadota bacterium]
MKAMLLRAPAPVAEHPLELADVSLPEPGPGEIRVAVRACGVCHTDLHIVEGDIPSHKLPVIPGHQIVGTVDKIGENVTRFQIGDRVGIPWLHETCGACEYCECDAESLCPNARFTGYDADGGYAEFTVVREDFAVPIPAAFGDAKAAPLLCAGIIGYRALRVSEVQPGQRLGLYGFGASAHIAIQVARHWDCEVFVFTRSEAHRELARQLGAVWTGPAEDESPIRLHSAIIFAPAGGLVPEALRVLDRGGTLALAGITMTPIPQMDYSLLYWERTVRSVANATRQDAAELMRLAGEIPIKTEVEVLPLEQANAALERVKHSQSAGATVLEVASC